jgi:hypothetical protein
VARKLPWVFVSDNPIKTAGYLIDHAGSAKAARACITAAVRLRKKPQGRPSDRNDGALLLRGATIWRNDKPRSISEAIRMAAVEFGYNEEEAQNIVRRLRPMVEEVRKTRRKAKV